MPILHLISVPFPKVWHKSSDNLSAVDYQRTEFISALLMIAPWTRDGITIELDAPPLSASYLHMTLTLLTRLGVAGIEFSPDFTSMHVPPNPVHAFDFLIEPDASGATYFWAAAAITPGSSCSIRDIGDESVV